MVKIDSHQHFWRYNRDTHAWIGEDMEVLKQDFLPPDLKKEMDDVGMNSSVAVQALQDETETDMLLDFAERYDFIKGVVGWLDICAPNFDERLAHYAQNPYLKGLRHLVQDEPNDRFLLRPDFLEGISKLASHNLTYDVLIFPRHLSVAREFVSKFSDQKFVIDHIAKPDIKNGKINEWASGMLELARHENVYCKISGLVTEADWDNWQPGDFEAYLEIVFNAFGTRRLMFGSDWPVCTLAADYGQVYNLFRTFIESFSNEEKSEIFGKNATVFYDLKNVLNNEE